MFTNLIPIQTIFYLFQDCAPLQGCFVAESGHYFSGWGKISQINPLPIRILIPNLLLLNHQPQYSQPFLAPYLCAIVGNIRNIIKRLVPFPLSKNHLYDRLTMDILKKHLKPDSNCIDVGAHKGEILDWFLKFAPAGRHFGFEPIPELFRKLQQKYSGKPAVSLQQLALSNVREKTSFNHVLTNPAYSGIKKRRYDRKHEKDTIIEVQTDLLDELIPEQLPIACIKIDVEGAELLVLKGAVRILRTYRPLVIFECGLGASDIYGTTADAMFDFFDGSGYRISLLQDFTRNQKPLDRKAFQNQFNSNENYYFIAHAGE